MSYSTEFMTNSTILDTKNTYATRLFLHAVAKLMADCGIKEINDNTRHEFERRAMIRQHIFGPPKLSDTEYRLHISQYDIEACDGLWSYNADAMTNAAFDKSILEALDRRARSLSSSEINRNMLEVMALGGDLNSSRAISAGNIHGLCMVQQLVETPAETKVREFMSRHKGSVVLRYVTPFVPNRGPRTIYVRANPGGRLVYEEAAYLYLGIMEKAGDETAIELVKLISDDATIVQDMRHDAEGHLPHDLDGLSICRIKAIALARSPRQIEAVEKLKELGFHSLSDDDLRAAGLDHLIKSDDDVADVAA